MRDVARAAVAPARRHIGSDVNLNNQLREPLAASTELLLEIAPLLKAIQAAVTRTEVARRRLKMLQGARGELLEALNQKQQRERAAATAAAAAAAAKQLAAATAGATEVEKNEDTTNNKEQAEEGVKAKEEEVAGAGAAGSSSHGAMPGVAATDDATANPSSPTAQVTSSDGTAVPADAAAVAADADEARSGDLTPGEEGTGPATEATAAHEEGKSIDLAEL
jgi:hypothetical protein